MPRPGTATMRAWSTIIGVCGTFLAVLVTFHPAMSGGFIWDDHAYLLSQQEARSVTVSSVLWAFSLDAAVSGHYHPLTWLSWMLDFAIAGGPDPRVFHTTNLLLHASHCVLLFFLFRILLRGAGCNVSGWAIVPALLLYALHPLRVESVAWVTERRDLLCGVFYAATLLAYLKAREQAGSRRWMVITCLFFVACGLSKAWALSLLPVMWVIDALVLRRLPSLRTGFGVHLAWLAERWIMVLCTLAFLAAGLVAAHRSGAMVGMDDLALLDRLQHAVFAWWYYPLKSLWPTSVAPYYGWAGFEHSDIRSYAAFVGFVLVWLAAFWRHARDPMPLAVLLSYTMIVLPVLGIVQSGPQLVADRYTYIAILPFHVALAALIGAALAGRGWGARLLSSVLAAMVIVPLALSAYRLNDVFSDEMAFWTRVVEVNPDDVTARHNRAKLAWQAGDHQLAIADLEAAVESQPGAVDSLSTLLDLHLALGDIDAAQRLADLARERQLPPAAQWRLASRIADAQGDPEGALEALRNAALSAEDDPGLWLALARLAGSQGAREEAAAALDAAVSLAPEDPDIRLERAAQFAALGRARQALDEVRAALALAPAGWPMETEALRWQAEIEGVLGVGKPAE